MKIESHTLQIGSIEAEQKQNKQVLVLLPCPLYVSKRNYHRTLQYYILKLRGAKQYALHCLSIQYMCVALHLLVQVTFKHRTGSSTRCIK